MRTLFSFSLVHSHEDTERCSIHPNLHDWRIESVAHSMIDILRLAMIIGGHAFPPVTSEHWYHKFQRKLPHAIRCVKYVPHGGIQNRNKDPHLDTAYFRLGDLFMHFEKFTEAEKMLRIAWAKVSAREELDLDYQASVACDLGSVFLE